MQAASGSLSTAERIRLPLPNRARCSTNSSRQELDIRPGDALRCKVDIETSYGPDHEVLAERYRIVDILEVLTTKSDGERSAPPEEQDVPREVLHEFEEASS